MEAKRETGNIYSEVVKEHNQQSNKVKLCGYLKKKRNKVGGWRRMWFVLQDKLLLSYSSKEEYDNKLVSFKDVLNLVPGTLVRPMAGFRFTIETTTNAMYTFHCDDRNAYREWIETLLDSLAGNRPINRNAQKCILPRFRNFSMDNIPSALAVTSAACNLSRRKMTSSFDSITQVERTLPSLYTAIPPLSLSPTITPTTTTKAYNNCVHLPIAHISSKILERNDMNNTKAMREERNSNNHHNHQQQQYKALKSYSDCSIFSFRLHQNTTLSTKMARSYFNQLLPDNINNGGSTNKTGTQLSTANKLTSKYFETQRQWDDNNHNKNNGYPTKSVQGGQQCKNCDDLNQGNKIPNSSETSASDINKSKNATLDDCNKPLTQMERIQRLHLRGTSSEFIHENGSNAKDQHLYTKVITSKNIEQRITELGSSSQTGATNSNEPIYAVVDLNHKYAHRRMRNMKFELKRCNSYDSIMQTTTTDETKAQRNEKSLSLTEDDVDDIDGIYEDGEQLFTVTSPSKLRSPTADEENIYEPINVIVPTQPSVLWKYFTRLKVNSFLTRINRRNVEYDTVKFPVINKGAIPTGKRIASTTSKPSSHFSTIRHKFGAHRKSMQMRMRKLYNRTHESKQPSNTVTSYCATPVSASKKKSKLRWRTVKVKTKNISVFNDETPRLQRRFFGSLPQMRKPRTSLFGGQKLTRTVSKANGDKENST